ncbi:MAG: hypothetical protein JEY96_14095 [Bacteroidales bacterium]|nr:hypothetical protein [Bacteroidales bacterium]
MDFIKWYKTKIDQSNLEPSEVVWEGIQDALDIDHSWHFINNHLKNQAVIRRRKVYAIAASLLLFISFGSYWLYNNTYETNKIEQLVQEVVIAEKSIYNKSGNIVAKSTNELIKENVIEKINTGNSSGEDATITKKFTEPYNNYPQGVKLAVIYRKEFFLEIETNDKISKSIISKGSIKDKEHERKAFKTLYLGTTGQLANTWLLNEKTYSGFESANLTTSNASFGSNWGLYIGSNLTKNIDMQFDLNILAQNNQDYNEYINGHYVSNVMKFSYSQAAVSVRYNLVSNQLMKGEHGVSFGGYMGYLHNAYQIVDGESLNLTDNYSHFDYGIFLAYEYVIPLYKKLGFGTGVRAYYGLKNIYAGNYNIPSYMNETKNASINISFSLKYSIK